MNDHDTNLLLDRAAQDSHAIDELMALHRPRVRRMLEIRMSQELLARVDPSDVVQETLIEATRLLPDYLTHQRIAFYPWVRGIAVSRMINLHRRHVLASKRSTRREEPNMRLPDESCVHLVDRLVHSGTSPSGRVEHEDNLERVKKRLFELPDAEREILVLKYLEELSADEIADVLGVNKRTVWRRHGRALERLGTLLGKNEE